MKSIKDISLDISEKEYRKDNSLSYSILSRYESEGFEGISTLYEEIETPSLTLGSAVDSIITGGMDEFHRKFVISSICIPPQMASVTKTLFSCFKESYASIEEIPYNIILSALDTLKYQQNWRPETRVKVIKEKGGEYYSLLRSSEGKTIIDESMASDVFKMTDSLKTSNSVKFYFEKDNPFDYVERCYQLKFKASFDNVPYKCMADLLLVHHDKKVVFPIDLKTSGKPEYKFYESFIKWNYQIQARLYWNIIRKNMNEDEYFKDFTLEDYRFVVVNKSTLNPLIWECPFTQSKGSIFAGKDRQIVLRDPLDIGRELWYYLKTERKTPVGINEIGLNDILKWINKI